MVDDANRTSMRINGSSVGEHGGWKNQRCGWRYKQWRECDCQFLVTMTDGEMVDGVTERFLVVLEDT